MKNFTLTLILTVLSVLLPISVMAQTEVDGLYFSIREDGTAYLYDIGKVSSHVTVPSQITYEGVIYPVTHIESGIFQNHPEITSVQVEAAITDAEGLFSSCTSLTSVSLVDGPEQLDNTFYGCTSLKEVQLPENSLKIVGKQTFYGCTSLGSINIPNSVTEIGDWAFYGCTSLYSVNFSSSLKTIGYYAFDGCTSLNAASLPSGLETIGWGAFADCTSLSEVSLPSSMNKLGDMAFYRCTSLSSVTIPLTTEQMGKEVFRECTSLESATLPEGTKYISEGLFLNCKKLASMTLPESLDSIGEDAFSNCTAMQSIYIGKNVKTVCDGAFQYCIKLAEVYYGGDIESWLAMKIDAQDYPEDTNPLSYATAFYIKGENGIYLSAENITVPQSVTMIKPYAFSGYRGLRSITIPESVEDIKEFAFYGCTGLTSIELRAQHISTFAFYAVPGLKEATIGRSLRSIGSMAFAVNRITKAVYEGNMTEWCSIDFGSNPFAEGQLYIDGELVTGEITIPCNRISDYAFYRNAYITGVTIPFYDAEIGESTFEGCTNIIYIKIGMPEAAIRQAANTEENNAGVKIGNYAFRSCIKLAEIEISENTSITELGDYVFDDTAWEKAQPDGVTYINDIAYSYNGDMPGNTILTIDEGTRIIAPQSFRNCNNLTAIKLPTSIERIGKQAFMYCTSLKEINLPEGINKLGESTFEECTSLTDMTLPAELTEVSERLFAGCTALKSVVIPAKVTTMGSSAFSRCGALEKITSLSEVPPTCHIPYPNEPGYEDYSDTFSSVPTSTCLLRVPEGSSNAYKNATGWKDFTKIEEFNTSGINDTYILNDNGKDRHYDISGKEIEPDEKGIHIIRYSNGSTRKVIVK